MTTTATAPTGLDGEQITLTNGDLDYLRSRAGGRVLRAGRFPGGSRPFSSGPACLSAVPPWLVEITRTYDPGNLFRSNRSIGA